VTIELKPEHQQMIDLAIQSGAYHNPDEVIGTAISYNSFARSSQDRPFRERRSGGRQPRHTQSFSAPFCVPQVILKLLI
jgi:Arc/MetJ-type ribon-helix-helix transcriptional regulator